ncbi:MAG TPA: hypothetical protein ENJ11_01740 [Gammaproteobacteria bacterium]|nr:hypothetical protein [Gammaproteobacteria bacterium]
MFNAYKKQSNALETFRIKAHLRSYVKDPVIVDDDLMQEAVEKLKKLPYERRDPAGNIAIELLLDGYRRGHFHYEDLTEEGSRLVRDRKYRRHHGLTERIQPAQMLKNHYLQFS